MILTGGPNDEGQRVTTICFPVPKFTFVGRVVPIEDDTKNVHVGFVDILRKPSDQARCVGKQRTLSYVKYRTIQTPFILIFNIIFLRMAKSSNMA